MSLTHTPAADSYVRLKDVEGGVSDKLGSQKGGLAGLVVDSDVEHKVRFAWLVQPLIATLIVVLIAIVTTVLMIAGGALPVAGAATQWARGGA